MVDHLVLLESPQVQGVPPHWPDEVWLTVPDDSWLATEECNKLGRIWLVCKAQRKFTFSVNIKNPIIQNNIRQDRCCPRTRHPNKLSSSGDEDACKEQNVSTVYVPCGVMNWFLLFAFQMVPCPIHPHANNVFYWNVLAATFNNMWVSDLNWIAKTAILIWLVWNHSQEPLINWHITTQVSYPQ